MKTWFHLLGNVVLSLTFATTAMSGGKAPFLKGAAGVSPGKQTIQAGSADDDDLGTTPFHRDRLLVAGNPEPNRDTVQKPLPVDKDPIPPPVYGHGDMERFPDELVPDDLLDPEGKQEPQTLPEKGKPLPVDSTDSSQCFPANKL